ncbi:conserved exported hypothetical protein [Paraburkholderia ribeironis]|uniref:Uncharacterized protein n=1 Tax=Paraburkholderia ribeironis TaxID=1247936 RepID=A0A1N7RX01_9BURK|nr:FimV/HubP family polar landmark protein [Paraburkholderia ribeironis]SIT39594.1 conserved exported hypothetical protein [Paraburkholderia ribeironis]
MNLRLSSLRAMFNHQHHGRLTAAAALAFALAGAGVGSAVAAPGNGASAPDAASVSYTAGSQYTVRAGQSLNDVAIAVTQSHDRVTLARATRALFDTNPSAFMNHDPSRVRVGAVLIVPALDASGGLAASSAGVAASVQAAVPASAPDSAAAPAASAVSGTASVVTDANPAASSGAAVGGAGSSAPVAGSQTAASPTSGAQEWVGSVQPSASEAAAEGAPASAAVTGAARSASQPRAQVSSLQQLLALKNRVLMELQKHGIGGSPAASSTVSTGAPQPAAAASSVAKAVSGQGVSAVSASNNGGFSQTELSAAAAVGAALVVLLAALRMRRRKRESVDAEKAASAQANESQDVVAASEQASVHEVSGADDGEAARQAAAVAAAQSVEAERAAAERVAAEQAAAERAAVDRAEAERAAVDRAEAERAAAERAEAERAAAERAEAERAAAERAKAETAEVERATAERAAAERVEVEHAAPARAAAEHAAEDHARAEPTAANPIEDRATAELSHVAPLEPAQPNANILPPTGSDFPVEALPATHRENLEGATTAASLAAAAELGAEALPLKPLEPVDETSQQDETDHRLQSPDEPARVESAAALEASAELPQNHPNAPQPVIDFPQQHVEPHTTLPFGQPHDDIPTHPLSGAPAQPVAPTEFPRDAVDAFGSLDMPLPPRIESAADSVRPPASLTTQPVASPETTAQKAFAAHGIEEPPHIADEIAAGTAGHAAVAGLGAAGFGALKLDFDLELPPSPAQPLPAFTQTDLIRIARNKLDLASEYIELGDLSGARTLINEVIEANDPATRNEARALLSTLAPLS